MKVDQATSFGKSVHETSLFCFYNCLLVFTVNSMFYTVQACLNSFVIKPFFFIKSHFHIKDYICIVHIIMFLIRQYKYCLHVICGSLRKQYIFFSRSYYAELKRLVGLLVAKMLSKLNMDLITVHPMKKSFHWMYSDHWMKWSWAHHGFTVDFNNTLQ